MSLPIVSFTVLKWSMSIRKKPSEDSVRCASASEKRNDLLKYVRFELPPRGSCPVWSRISSSSSFCAVTSSATIITARLPLTASGMREMRASW